MFEDGRPDDLAVDGPVNDLRNPDTASDEIARDGCDGGARLCLAGLNIECRRYAANTRNYINLRLALKNPK
jgi:hypothetical protein